MGFVNIMDQNMAKYRIGVQIKKMVVVPVCLNGRCCSSGCVGINQDKGDESQPPLAFRRDVVNSIFFGIFKGRQITLERCKNSKYPIRCLL